MIPLLIIVYLFVAFLVYGFVYGYEQRHYPNIANNWRSSDKSMALVTALIWPLMFPCYLIAQAITGGFKEWHGFQWR